MHDPDLPKGLTPLLWQHNTEATRTEIDYITVIDRPKNLEPRESWKVQMIKTLQRSTSQSRSLKVLMSLVLAVSVSVVVAPASSAATLGSACTKVGAKSKIGNVSVICNQVGGKRILTEEAVTNLSVTANAVIGGKNAQTANFIRNYVIPNFELNQALKGKNVSVNFISCSGSCDDNAFKSSLALDLLAKRGADVFAIDGFWVAEFAEAGYIKPLNRILPAKRINSWEGWRQIPANVQGVMIYENQRYGIPQGTDGRIIYYNKKMFQAAGLPTNWQPKSWADIVTAAKRLKSTNPDTNPIQINGGDGMGEATAMQGVLNLLGGAGSLIYDPKAKKWEGNTKAVRAALGFYDTVYNVEKIGKGSWQLLAGENGRNESFKSFAKGETAMLIEGDYFWRSVINPTSSNAPMADRDTNVGFAKIPAQTPKSGYNGQSFMSMSGGSGYALNQYAKNKPMAWELLKFMNSREAVQANMAIGGAVRITQRADVNAVTLKSDPCLKFVFEQAIPNTHFRPPLADYNAASVLLQKATTAVIQGTSPEKAAADYETALKALVGANNVKSN